MTQLQHHDVSRVYLACTPQELIGEDISTGEAYTDFMGRGRLHRDAFADKGSFVYALFFQALSYIPKKVVEELNKLDQNTDDATYGAEIYNAFYDALADLVMQKRQDTDRGEFVRKTLNERPGDWGQEPVCDEDIEKDLRFFIEKEGDPKRPLEEILPNAEEVKLIRDFITETAGGILEFFLQMKEAIEKDFNAVKMDQNAKSAQFDDMHEVLSEIQEEGIKKLYRCVDLKARGLFITQLGAEEDITAINKIFGDVIRQLSEYCDTVYHLSGEAIQVSNDLKSSQN